MSREYVVTVTPTKHSVPSFGFIVWERRKKLKAEYQSLSGAEIRDLRLLGKEVSEEHRRPLIAYLGDSAPEGLDAAPEMYEAEILITEMTFLSPHHRRQKIHKFGHLHLEDVIERRERFNNKLIIASHFSTRYHKNTIRNLVEKRFPTCSMVSSIYGFEDKFEPGLVRNQMTCDVTKIASTFFSLPRD